MTAARLLRYYKTPEVVEALYDSVQDEDHLVRNISAESLLYIHGLPATISEHYEEISAEILVYYDREDEEKRKEARKHYKKAAEMLRAVIESKSN